jgi:hypothetical protein
MKRTEILEAAARCVCGDREQDYGSPEDSFSTIAALWNAYLGELDKLKFERWAQLAQISYERQKAETDAIRAQMGK